MTSEHRAEKCQITCLPNGPYYLSGTARLDDPTPRTPPHSPSATGESGSTVADAALCRCGGSQTKPFCDGTHSTIGFTDEKVADASLDKRQSYVGEHITIHDNRALCAHAGQCAIAAVFSPQRQPWINPDGASAEEIIDTINKCPSGALSYTIHGVEHRDQDRPMLITVIENGPYAVTGDIALSDQDRGEGASTEHYTLCRCGGSKNKPFCDGTHWQIQFKDPQD